MVRHTRVMPKLSKCETKAIPKTDEVVWNSIGELDWVPGEALEFSINSAGPSGQKVVGTVVVPSEHFQIEGLHMELPTDGPESAALTVCITPQGVQMPFGMQGGAEGGKSMHEMRRMQKGYIVNCQTIENRIRFFKREEEKIWRDLEEVRRQAAKIEEGRTQAKERHFAERALNQVREQKLTENRVRASKQRLEMVSVRKQYTADTMASKQFNGENQRRDSQDILRRKRLEEAQQRLNKSERVVASQREQIESKLRSNQEKQAKLGQIRDAQQMAREDAEHDMTHVESRLPELEAQEMACLHRLQNSRIVTQTVLRELEASLGSNSAVTSMLRMKQSRSANLLGTYSAESDLNDTDLSPNGVGGAGV